jgi:ferredoxin
VERAEVHGRYALERKEFPQLIGRLRSLGYRVVGPTVRDGAIVYGDIRTEQDLPIGWTEKQDAGKYRLERRSDAALFGYNLGPHSWKKYMFLPHERLWTARRTEQGFDVVPEPNDAAPLAFLGARACEIAAMGVQDRVFGQNYADPGYVARRSRSLTIAVQCGQAAKTCFCVSMGTGPGVTGGYDLSLTEILTPTRHHFLVEVGSERGAEALQGVPLSAAPGELVEAAHHVVEKTTASMGRSMSTEGIHDLLLKHPDHPRWEVVAQRCLSCANCTLACPTCFCSTTEDVPSLSGETAERWRRWDSCFNMAFTELHAMSVRKSGMSRYRQWLTHKLAAWHDQFGVSGCVGCGRCITWCPVGIDLTEEVAALRATPAGVKSAGGPP